MIRHERVVARFWEVVFITGGQPVAERFPLSLISNTNAPSWSNSLAARCEWIFTATRQLFFEHYLPSVLFITASSTHTGRESVCVCVYRWQINWHQQKKCILNRKVFEFCPYIAFHWQFLLPFVKYVWNCKVA